MSSKRNGDSHRETADWCRRWRRQRRSASGRSIREDAEATVSKDEARSYLKMRMKKHAGKMLGMVLETNRSSPDEWPSRRAVL